MSEQETGFTLHAVLAHAEGATALSAAEARLRSLHQGRASAMTGRALAGKVVPALPGHADALDAGSGPVRAIGALKRVSMARP
ncbi:hypothetical protein [Streptomyces canarius]